MQNLPMDVLRSFVTISELGGFTQAGELLGRSQPAISLQIKRLEELIAASVFQRNGQRLELTPAGEQLLRYARDILSLNDKALSEFKKPSIAGLIRFGVPSEFATTLLPKILGRFAKNYPKVTLAINCDLSKNLLSQPSCEYDLILALQDKPSASQTNLVKKDDLVWVTSRHHDSHLQSPLPLIVAPEPCIYRATALRSLDNHHLPCKIVFTNPDLTGINAAIEEGLGVTVLAKSTVSDSMRIIQPSKQFPQLGKVGIHLLYDHRTASEATIRLVEYVHNSLV